MLLGTSWLSVTTALVPTAAWSLHSPAILQVHVRARREGFGYSTSMVTCAACLLPVACVRNANSTPFLLLSHTLVAPQVAPIFRKTSPSRSTVPAFLTRHPFRLSLLIQTCFVLNVLLHFAGKHNVHRV